MYRCRIYQSKVEVQIGLRGSYSDSSYGLYDTVVLYLSGGGCSLCQYQLRVLLVSNLSTCVLRMGYVAHLYLLGLYTGCGCHYTNLYGK